MFRCIKNNLFLLCLLSISTIFTIACNEPTPQTNNTDKIYFDLTKVIQQDINRNSTNKCIEEKTVYIQNQKETKRLDTIDWKEELKPLLECDINKPAWKGQFYVDTIPNDVMKDTTLQYRALNDKVSIRLMSVIYDSTQIKKIIIVKKISSFLFSTNQTIDYYPTLGFAIRGEQKALMMKAFDLNVDVKYVCK